MYFFPQNSVYHYGSRQTLSIGHCIVILFPWLQVQCTLVLFDGLFFMRHSIAKGHQPSLSSLVLVFYCVEMYMWVLKCLITQNN